MLARRYIVRGRVQGVGFRWFVEREARNLGLVGWVRNNEDSTVELLAAGDAEKLAALRARLEEGPRASRVETARLRSSAFQSPLAAGASISLKTMSTIPSRRSVLFATWL